MQKMILKTLRTDGKKTQEVIGDLSGDLYPEDTKRVVVAYFLFPTTLNGEERRGIQLLEQRASVERISKIDLVTQYNGWHNCQFVDYSFQ